MLSDSPCNDALSSVCPAVASTLEVENSKNPSCTRSTPFICTSHAYRKRNKVYTQCCWCLFFFFYSHQEKDLQALWRVQPLLFVCFLEVGGEFYSCEHGLCQGFSAAPLFPSLTGPRLTFWSPSCQVLIDGFCLSESCSLCLERVWSVSLDPLLPAAGWMRKVLVVKDLITGESDVILPRWAVFRW